MPAASPRGQSTKAGQTLDAARLVIGQAERDHAIELKKEV